MEKCIADYVRLLDIDPSGYFLRLINTSLKQSIDLSNIDLQQRLADSSSTNGTRVVHVYRFASGVRPLLPAGEFATIYARDYSPARFEIRPHMFLASEVSRWSVDILSPIELSINQLVFDRYRPSILSDSDVPLLFINRTVPLRSTPIPMMPATSARRASCHFPYALPVDNIFHPHSSGASDSETRRRKVFTSEECSQIVKSFDSYPRRLTSASTRGLPVRNAYFSRRGENVRASFAS